MALTSSQQQLIAAVSQNDLKKAKAAAKACLAEDKTQKNRPFVERYSRALDNDPHLLEIPLNLRGRLIVEDVSDTFNENRYYLSGPEAATFAEIEKMKKVSAKLKELRIPYINATMLSGEPGTGKTEFGRYIAYKLGLPFCYVNFSQLVDSLMGKTSANLNLIFNYVKTIQCVFMLDEVDCIAMKRGKAGDSGPDGELSRTVITLMQEFDSLPNDIIVIGATNRIDKLDPAFLSRFSAVHEVRAFSVDESVQMVHRFLDDISFAITEPRIRAVCAAEKTQRKIMKAIVKEISNQLLDDGYAEDSKDAQADESMQALTIYDL